MSQEEIAILLGVHRNTWARWESGKGEPDLTVLGKIAQKMRISLEWLVMGTGEMYHDVTITNPLPSVSKEGIMETSDSRKATGDIFFQYLENNDKKINLLSKMSDMSVVTPLYEENRSLYQKNMELQEHVVELTEQLATLRIQLERRDMRIYELEKENAGLREAQKGASRVQNQIFGAGA